MIVNWCEKKKRGGQALPQTLCWLSGAKGCDEQIKHFWRGDCSALIRFIYVAHWGGLMSYQLRISILYTGMRINNQTALSRAFAFFLIVFLPVDLFFGKPETILKKVPVLLSPASSSAACHGCLTLDVLFVVTSDRKVELKRRSNHRRCSRLTVPPRLCAKEVPPFWLRFLHVETGAIFSHAAVFFVHAKIPETFPLQCNWLICLPVNNNENSIPLLKEAELICKYGFMWQ